MKRGVYLTQGLTTVLVVVWAILVGVSPVEAQSSGFRIAVLTPGLTFDTVLQGLREGLARLGYEEGKQITFILEETQGATPELAQRARRLAEAKPDVLVAITDRKSVV